MRVLFTAPAVAGHLFPQVPTALALRAAGHEVLVAGWGRMDLYEQTGIPAVSLAEEPVLQEMFKRHGVTFSKADPETMMRGASVVFGELCRPTIGPLLDLVDTWLPDVLVYDSFQGAAPLVAAKAGIPAVEHQFGVLRGRMASRFLAERLADDYRAYGVDTEGVPQAVSLEIVPPSIRAHDPHSWQMRYVPFNGPGLVPADVLRPTERPRILVTLGTVVVHTNGLDALTGLVRAASRMDVDFLLAMGGVDLSGLGALPANVRVLPYAPLTTVLSACDAIVHHGGSGSMMSAVTQGVPQLLLPHGADNFVNAEAAVAAGFGLQAEADEVDAVLLSRLIEDPELRAGAEKMRLENQDQPSPAQLVSAFEELASAHRS